MVTFLKEQKQGYSQDKPPLLGRFEQKNDCRLLMWVRKLLPPTSLRALRYKLRSLDLDRNDTSFWSNDDAAEKVRLREESWQQA